MTFQWGDDLLDTTQGLDTRSNSAVRAAAI